MVRLGDLARLEGPFVASGSTRLKALLADVEDGAKAAAEAEEAERLAKAPAPVGYGVRITRSKFKGGSSEVGMLSMDLSQREVAVE